ncbi:MAG: hypothetical protein ACP5NV_04070 [Candidatus Woesearchaeota archaeon]
MAKVMIIDDRLIGQNNRMRGMGNTPETPEELSKHLETIEDVEYFDLTSEYVAAGGKDEHSIYLLAQPKTAVHTNILGHIKEKGFEVTPMLEANFNFETAINTIEKEKPDIILLDMQITSWIPERLKNIYLENLRKIIGTEVVFDDKNKNYIFSLHNYYGSQKDKNPLTLTEYEELHIGESGGVFLGQLLKEKNIPFSFWTSDYGHARPSIIHAYVLGLLEAEDIISSFKNGYTAKPYLNHSTGFPEYNVIPNNRGNLLVDGKEIFTPREEYSIHSNKFTERGIHNLETAITIASKYKNEKREK